MRILISGGEDAGDVQYMPLHRDAGALGRRLAPLQPKGVCVCLCVCVLYRDAGALGGRLEPVQPEGLSFSLAWYYFSVDMMCFWCKHGVSMVSVWC
jgi:hypothetical protein